MQLSTDKGRQTQNPRNSTKLVKLISDTRITERLEKSICEWQVMALSSISLFFIADVVVKLRRYCKSFSQEFHR